MNLLAILLTVLFVGLKLAGYIAWAWVWVLAPLWIWLILFFVVWAIIFAAFVSKA